MPPSIEAPARRVFAQPAACNLPEVEGEPRLDHYYVLLAATRA